MIISDRGGEPVLRDSASLVAIVAARDDCSVDRRGDGGGGCYGRGLRVHPPAAHAGTCAGLRTLAEYDELFAKADLQTSRIVALDSLPWTLIEVIPR